MLPELMKKKRLKNEIIIFLVSLSLMSNKCLHQGCLKHKTSLLQKQRSRSVLRGCLHVKFKPGMKLVSGWNDPCLWWNVSYCLHVFAEMKVHLGMKDKDQISSRDEKKTCKHFIPGWHFKISVFFFFNFWRMYSSMFSKFSMFEHNERMNIMKHKASL